MRVLTIFFSMLLKSMTKFPLQLTYICFLSAIKLEAIQRNKKPQVRDNDLLLLEQFGKRKDNKYI